MGAKSCFKVDLCEHTPWKRRGMYWLGSVSHVVMVGQLAQCAGALLIPWVCSGRTGGH